jgi:hypothetical protein
MLCTCKLEGLMYLACGEKKLGLTIVKEKVLGLIMAGGEWLHDGDRWCIMWWAVKGVG